MHMYEELYNWTFGKNIDSQLFPAVYENRNNFRRTFETMALDCDSLISDCVYR